VTSTCGADKHELLKRQPQPLGNLGDGHHHRGRVLAKAVIFKAAGES
jgi:hypothetical protein